MRVAVYLRVSTLDQDPESQGREVRAFVAGRGWEISETYQDVGISGAKIRRPALDRLLKDACGRISDDMVLREARRVEAFQNGDKNGDKPARAPMEAAVG